MWEWARKTSSIHRKIAQDKSQILMSSSLSAFPMWLFLNSACRDVNDFGKLRSHITFFSHCFPFCLYSLLLNQVKEQPALCHETDTILPWFFSSVTGMSTCGGITCQNGGSCSLSAGAAFCICATGFTGTFCQTSSESLYLSNQQWVSLPIYICATCFTGTFCQTNSESPYPFTSLPSATLAPYAKPTVRLFIHRVNSESVYTFTSVPSALLAPSAKPTVILFIHRINSESVYTFTSVPSALLAPAKSTVSLLIYQVNSGSLYTFTCVPPTQYEEWVSLSIYVSADGARPRRE